jgi:hypothetical protein
MEETSIFLSEHVYTHDNIRYDFRQIEGHLHSGILNKQIRT